jgi:hypothetical protein
MRRTSKETVSPQVRSPLPSKALEKALVRHEMSFASSTWDGVWIEQAFSCRRGHITHIAPRNLIRQREQGCRICAHEDATKLAAELASAASSRWLDHPWRGVAARYRFRCAQGHKWSCLGQSLLRGASCTECKLEERLIPGALLRDGLDRLHARASEQGGVCLSKKYTGTTASYRFRCGAGHRFAKTGVAVLYNGVWCPDCPRSSLLDPDGLQRLREAARAKGGVCLSPEYLGTGERHSFRCDKGHVWSTQAGTILYQDGWCRRCQYEAAMAPDGLERLKRAAAEKNGQCLARKYNGYHGKYRFRCEAGHSWQTSAQSILRGGWCPECAEAHAGSWLLLKNGLEQLKARAAEHGGECLTDEYLGTAILYPLRCKKGHEWRSKGGAILAGRWCQTCAIDAQRCTIEDARSVAQARGGACLSEVYRNAKSHLTWQCHRGHVWAANFDNVRNKGKWCPDCSVLNRITSAKSKARIRLGPG